jgi:hypothetical protein
VRLATLLVVGVAAAVGCAHPTGEKGGLVTVRASADEVQKAFSGRRFALLIGIPKSRDEHWQPLRYATKDVEDLGAVLQDPLRGRFAHVESLITPEDTTRDAVRAAVARLAALATQPEDVVVLYVSAHGTLARDARGELERYLVTSDADFHHVSQTGLPIDALSKGLEASRSRRRVVVLATCHSGSGKSLLPEDVAAELASRKGGVGLRPLEEASRASIVLSASDFLETAREDETLQNDVYTHWLIEALTGGGDRNGDGAVTATEAHDYARRRTWVFSQGRQRPSAELFEVGADPVVLTGDVRRGGQPELYSYVPRLDGFTLRVDGIERAELPGGAAVGAGAHRVELTKGDEVLFSEDVDLDVGARVDLDGLARKKEPFFAMTATGGAFGFLDATSRQQVLPISPAVGVSVRFERVLLKRLSVELDLSGFGGQGGLTFNPTSPAVPFAWSSVLAGVSLAYQWDWRWVSVWFGPRVAGLWVQRSFSLDAYQGTQSAFSFTPGVLLGGALHLTPRWELSVGLQGSVVVVAVDGVSQTLGFAGAWAGVGYRF